MRPEGKYMEGISVLFRSKKAKKKKKNWAMVKGPLADHFSHTHVSQFETVSFKM